MKILVDIDEEYVWLNEPIKVILAYKADESAPAERIYIEVERTNELHLLTELLDALIHRGWKPEPIIESNIISRSIYNALERGYIPLTPVIYYTVDSSHVSIRRLIFDEDGNIKGDIMLLLYEA